MRSEIAGQQVIPGHIGHHIQPGVVPRSAFAQRRSGGDVVLEARRQNDRLLVLNVNKQWEIKESVIELDGTNMKR